MFNFFLFRFMKNEIECYCWCCCCYERPKNGKNSNKMSGIEKKSKKKYMKILRWYRFMVEKKSHRVYRIDLIFTVRYHFVYLLEFVFHFQPNATCLNPLSVRVFSLYIGINQISIWNFSDLFSTTPPVAFAVDRFVLCIAMLVCKIQLQLKQNEKKNCSKIKLEYSSGVKTGSVHKAHGAV